MKAGQVAPGLWHQGGETGDEVERLEDDMGGAIAIWRLELVANVAVRRERLLREAVLTKRSMQCRRMGTIAGGEVSGFEKLVTKDSGKQQSPTARLARL